MAWALCTGIRRTLQGTTTWMNPADSSPRGKAGGLDAVTETNNKRDFTTKLADRFPNAQYDKIFHKELHADYARRWH